VSDLLDQLSARQHELLALVADGVTVSKELAVRVGLAPRTIDNLLSRAVRILNAQSREDAGLRYRELKEICHDPCHVTSAELVTTPEIEPLGGAGDVPRAVPSLAKRLFDLPLGGAEHSLAWDEVTLRIIRVAFLGLLSLTALVIFVLAFFRTFG